MVGKGNSVKKSHPISVSHSQHSNPILQNLITVPSSLNSAEGWEPSCTIKCAQFVFTTKNTVCSVVYNSPCNTEPFLLAALTIYLFIAKRNKGCSKTIAPCPKGKRRILKTIIVKSLLPSKGHGFNRQPSVSDLTKHFSLRLHAHPSIRNIFHIRKTISL